MKIAFGHRSWVAELAVVTVVAALTTLDAWWNAPGTRPADPVTFLLVASSIGALLVRRRLPVTVAVGCGAALTAWTALGHRGELLNLPTIVALYAVAVTGSRRRTVLVGMAAVLWSGLAAALIGGDTSPVAELVWPVAALRVRVDAGWRVPGVRDASTGGDRGMTVRVVLADDQQIVRAGFRALLDLTDDLVVVGEAADGQAAVAAARRTRPDVVLMDIRMPTVDGLEATRRITADPELDAVRVLVLTTFELDEYVFESLRAGASGFLLKDVEPEQLSTAIRVIAAGQSLLAPAVTRRVIDEFSRLRGRLVEPERLEVLTDREREVVTLVAAGLSNDEIAARLYLSPLTAKTHVSRAMTKLGVRDRAQLVVLAYETGLASIGG